MTSVRTTCLGILLTLGSLVSSVRGQPDARSSNGGFEKAIQSALPRVVKLYGLGAGQQKGYGSGLLVSEDGQVLTVFSLLIDARRIRAVTADGTQYLAEVIHRDRDSQLALLQLKTYDASTDTDLPEHSFAYFDLDEEVEVLPGDWVLAAGNPFKVADGPEPVSIAHGIISTKIRLDARRRLKDFPYRGEVFVIDGITSNPGAPGSAVVNIDGAFVGMIGRVVTSNRTFTHLNYALPRSVLRKFLSEAANAQDPDYVTPKTPEDPTFDPGIRLSRVGYQKILPFVERVTMGSPAHLAGVRKDDLILSINGRNVGDASTYDDRLRYAVPGEPIDIVIQRGRNIVSVRIETKKP